LDFSGIDEPFDITDMSELDLSNTVIKGGREGIFRFVESIKNGRNGQMQFKFRLSKDSGGQLIEEAVRDIFGENVDIIMNGLFK
jgi:hypothetical protein